VTPGSSFTVFASLLALVAAGCANSDAAKNHGAGGAATSGTAGRDNAGGSSGAAGMTSVAGAFNGTGGMAGTLGGSGSSGVPAAGGQAGSAVNGTSGVAGVPAVAGRGGASQAGSGASGAGAVAQGGDADEGGAGPIAGTPTEVGLASLPVARQEHGVVAVNGKVYVLGGYTPDVTASVLAYDPSADSWHAVSDFPSPFNHPAAGVIGNQIYVAGFYAGTSLTGPATGRTFVYDPTADHWTEKKALPSGTERAGGCVAILGTDLYVFGGGNSGDATSFASVYDTVNDSWRTLPDLPETREHCAAFASGGKLYVVGGRTHNIPEFRPSTLEFDPVAGTYTEKTPIPVPRGGLAGAVLGGRLFVFGGEGADNSLGVFDDINAYDAATDSWQTFPPLIVPRHGFGAATLGDRIYLPGGAIHQGGAATDAVTTFYFE
jgi:N-acetylneuraminic acid mutarotase